MRRLVVVLVVVLLAWTAPAARPSGEPSPHDAAQRLLDARADAVRRGDRAAFLATVDPQAPASFRDGQARSFDGLRSLPLASFGLTIRTDDSGDLGPGVAARYPGARVYLPETRLRYRFEGYDDRDEVESRWFTFVERDGRWYIAGDGDLSGVGVDSATDLWDEGPVEAQRTPHFLLLSHPGQAERARGLSGPAEQAIALLAPRWDRPWSQHIPLLVPGSVGELETVLQSTFDLDNFVAFVVADETSEAPFPFTAPRIYIQDANLARDSQAFQLQTLVHELVHAAATPLRGPFDRAWVEEGVADWVAYGRSTSEAPPAGSDGRLPRDDEFTTGGRDAIIRSYAESRSAMSFLAARWGMGAPTALLGALGSTKLGAGNVDYWLDRAVRRVTGLGFEDFQRAWAERRR